VGKPEIEDLFV